MMHLEYSRFVLLLAAAAAVTALGTGCATSSQAQSGRWSPQGDREYLSEQHLPYQDFSLLGGEQQNAYLMWRHAHPDAGSSAASC